MRQRQFLIIAALILVLFISVIFLFSRFSQQQTRNETNTSDFTVTTSFYPINFFASEIAGTRARVRSITPIGVEPHDYEPTSQDIVEMENSKLIILNGEIEPWGNKIKDLLKSKNTPILTVGEGLFNQEVMGEGKLLTDPHIWLSPTLVQTEVQAIYEGFVLVDPEYKDYYSTNKDALIQKLEKLDQTYQVGLQSCAKHKFITAHAAFGYLAGSYGLEQIAITGISPDQEPSLRDLARITRFATENNIKYIFFESLVSPELATTLAKEVGAQTLVLNPLEGLTRDEIERGENYFTVMEQNLKNLRLSLVCQ